jgi:hypothetical protein
MRGTLQTSMSRMVAISMMVLAGSVVAASPGGGSSNRRGGWKTIPSRPAGGVRYSRPGEHALTDEEVRMRARSGGGVVALCLLVTLAGCAAQPRQRAYRTGPVAEGPDTMEAVRQALQGRWTLTSLNISSEDGRTTPVEATGMLTSDAFGNLEIHYKMSEAGQKALANLGIKSPNPAISTTGRVVIDPQQRQITYAGEDFEKRAMGFDPNLAALRANPFALERTRYYTFGEDGTLTLATRHDNGRDAVVSRWKKA